MHSGLQVEIDSALRALDSSLGKEFGNPGRPLLLSVRSGAKSTRRVARAANGRGL